MIPLALPLIRQLQVGQFYFGDWSDGMDPAFTFQDGLCVGQDGNELSKRRAREGPKVDIRTLGIDLAKNLFRVHGVDARGKTILQRQLRRRQLLPFLAQVPSCLVAMEACGGAHYWAREIVKLGHEVRLISPRFVRPYVKSSKNDARDAEAICEAVARPSMRFVAVKNQVQQDMLALHRVRALLIRERTALMNQMRGLLAEYGVVVAMGAAHLRQALAEIVGDHDERVSALFREALVEMSERLRSFEERLEALRQADRGSRAETTSKAGSLDDRARRWGLLIATALIATVGDARQFKYRPRIKRVARASAAPNIPVASAQY